MSNLALAPVSSLHGKRVLITGANGGLGLETSAAVLREGAKLVMACRSPSKAAEAREQVLAMSGAPSDHARAFGRFDMLNPAQIQAAVAGLPEDPIDVVFLQAGGWVFTDDVATHEFYGEVVEKTVFLNVIGAHATLKALKASGRLAEGARVVIIGGEGARGIPGMIPRPSFQSVGDFQRYLSGDWSGRAPYVPMAALGVSKFAAGLWALALSRRAADLDVVWFTPGLIGGTGGTGGMPKWNEFLFQKVAFPVFVALGMAQWPAAAAAKCVDALAGRIGQRGDLLGAPEGKAIGPITNQKPMQPHFADEAFQDAMWEVAERAAGTMPVGARHAAS